MKLSCGNCKSIQPFSGEPLKCDVCGWVSETRTSSKPNDPASGAVRVLAIVLAVVLVQFGGWSAFRRYIRHRISHEKLASLLYHGEWSLGEYRECVSINLRAEDKEPKLLCVDSSAVGAEKVFNVSFSGDLTYDDEKPEDAVHYWLCRRNDGAPSFSCGAKSNPAGDSSQNQTAQPTERQLSDSEIENLRKRNECEQRFYNKKIYKVDGMSIGPACKQNPDRLP